MSRPDPVGESEPTASAGAALDPFESPDRQPPAAPDDPPVDAESPVHGPAADARAVGDGADAAGADAAQAAPAAAGDARSPAAEEDVLEELVLPSLIQPLEPVPPGTDIGPEGRLRVVEHLGTRGRINRYAATWQDDAGASVPVELREGPADDTGLRREAEILGAVRYAMLPAHRVTFEQGERLYLAIDRLGGETLAEALRAGLPPDRALSIVLQLVQAARRLHRSGWAVLGLAPTDVYLAGDGSAGGQPVRIVHLGHAARIGEPPSQALHIAGYSAPELSSPAPVTGKEDVYTLGAILYHALAGQPLPETGAELTALSATLRTPGAPQLLAGVLVPADERIDLEAFYRGLLALRQRLADAPVALEVASATTVGLNPTRTVNEDACGYATWSVAVADGVTYRALLCVADGMGGMDAGEVASRAALTAVMRGTASLPAFPAPVAEGGAAAGPPGGAGTGAGAHPSPAEAPDQPSRDAGSQPPPLDPVALVRAAAPVVHAAAQGRQMGTTVTLVAVQDGELTLGHIGDTRAYLLREGTLTQLTADHSLVAAMVASGVITPEEAEGHPDSNKVLRSLGSRRELPNGYVDGLEARYRRPTLRLQPGDWLVVCSDGVWGSVDDAAIRTVAAEALDPPTAARRLVELALEAGAPDNATTVVARCVRVPGA